MRRANGVSELHYHRVRSNFGQMLIVWRPADCRVLRIFLPKQLRLFETLLRNSAITAALPGRPVRAMCRGISGLLRGRPVVFDLDVLDWSVTSFFQKRVLLAECNIPGGKVSTYSRIASKIGSSSAARAVGNALAKNPFPLVIPCHRAIRNDGSLGGYAGGIDMKKKLLELEGIEFDSRGRVVTREFW
ncbi:MAG: methylated-DNA--[protein]-cysteine S-methyltransferase [candidate division WOR-3 bacterium]|nr:MAG: methylated-DNA--[protein]-cysteine S-methyltransferase [candidate division WOR-3 bacterium]